MTVDRTVGVLGVGRVGAGMVSNLVRSPFDVVVAPRDPAVASALGRAGATVVSHPADMGARAACVITSLPDIAAVRDVLMGPRGLLSAGPWPGVVIETSTLGPHEARALHAELRDRGTAMIDAPVSGGAEGAANGTLSIMVGGDDASVRRAMPVLDVIGGRVVHCGGPGAGQVAKACNQLIVMTTLVAVAEALTLARHAGIDGVAAREAMLGGLAASPILESQGLRMLEGDFNPGGRIGFHRKDMAAIAGLCEETALQLPVFDAVRARFEEVLGMAGASDLDHAAIVACYPGWEPVTKSGDQELDTSRRVR
jgi:2-hydroxy-3-oxopropionate reductase